MELKGVIAKRHVLWYSKDQGKTWSEFHPYLNRDKQFFKEIVEEAKKAKKDFFKERSKKRAKERQAELKSEAKKLGISLDEIKVIKDKEKQEKQKEKEQSKFAVTFAKNINKKMAIASSLKTLLEIGNDLQEKLLSEEELDLRHVHSRIHKIDEAVRILEQWSRKPPKKSK